METIGEGLAISNGGRVRGGGGIDAGCRADREGWRHPDPAAASAAWAATLTQNDKIRHMLNDRREVQAKSGPGIFLSLLVLALGFPVAADAGESLPEALVDGKFSLNTRLRYENVKSDAFSKDANATTLRVRLGYGTGDFKGFKAFIEGSLTRDLEPDNFNSTVNGKTAYPTVADPDSTRLSRATLAYSGLANTTITAGRQRIKLDNDRFIGNVGFRQTEQTYDAARVTNTSLWGVKLDYTYLWQVNRIFGSKSAVGRFDANSHLLNVSYDIAGIGKITGYGYLIDLSDSPANSNQTYGVRFMGARKAGKDVTLIYAAEFASQSDFAGNASNYRQSYTLAEGGAKVRGFTARVGYEQLGGNGTNGFRTPLATGHAFQGFADNFLTTPASGVTDLQAFAAYVFKDVGVFGNIKVAGWYHDFEADAGNTDLGEEFDLLIALKPWKSTTLAAKYANFSGATSIADVGKFWLSLDIKY